jgi:hypothetical protein
MIPIQQIKHTTIPFTRYLKSGGPRYYLWDEIFVYLEPMVCWTKSEFTNELTEAVEWAGFIKHNFGTDMFLMVVAKTEAHKEWLIEHSKANNSILIDLKRASDPNSYVILPCDQVEQEYTIISTPGDVWGVDFLLDLDTHTKHLTTNSKSV